jgi:transposase-like protein
MKICPKCESDNVIMIQYSYTSKYHYDGVSEYNCRDCGYRQGRWCGQELKDKECERVFCSGGSHPTEIYLDDNTRDRICEGQEATRQED